MLRNEASYGIYLPQRHRVHREKKKRFKIGAYKIMLRNQASFSLDNLGVQACL